MLHLSVFHGIFTGLVSYGLRHSDSTFSIRGSRSWYVYCGNGNTFHESETKFLSVQKLMQEARGNLS